MGLPYLYRIGFLSGLRFPEFALPRPAHARHGQPSTIASGGWGAERADFAALSADFLVALNGALSLAETKVFMHQVSIILPLTN